MSATDELRRMLDERGVEWEADDRQTYAFTYWGDWAFTEPLDAKPHTLGAQCELMLMPATPEQAIAATLGDDGVERSNEGVSRWHELFGTPERAARTLFDYGSEVDYDALLEWLRGDA